MAFITTMATRGFTLNHDNNDNNLIDIDLLWIFIIVACVTIIGIFCISIWLIRKKYNNNNDLEKSLMKDSEYISPSRLELQLKDEKTDYMHRAKISSYDFETPGCDQYDGTQITENTAPDLINDEVDEYLAHSDNDDSENDDMYNTLPSITPQ